MRPVALAVALLLAVSCSEPTEPDPLRELVVPVSGTGTYLMSVPLDPGRNLSVSGVELTAGDGLEGEYLGYVTRCGELCEISQLSEDDRNGVAASVEGRVPFQVQRSVEGPYLLFAVTVAQDGARTLRRGECLVVRDVILTLDSGERISVRRPGYRFLWVLSRDAERSCLEEAPQR